MKIAVPKQMREIDQKTIDIIGIPGIVLMENAAIKLVEEVCLYFDSIEKRKILLFAGKGNNGGDSFAAARILLNKKAIVKVYIVAQEKDIKGDAWINLNILKNMGIDTVEISADYDINTLQNDLASADLIVDGIFGTGLKGCVSGAAKKVIGAINGSNKRIVSIDIPSGIDGETGSVLDTCIKADKTVTFGLPKIGLLIHPGCDFVGELIVKDIGIPEKVVEELNICMHLTEKSYVSRVIPKRKKESNKGDYGKIFVLTGSIGMTGSGCLTASAALRVGAGLVYLGVPASLTGIYESILKETITIPLEDHKEGYLSIKSIDGILERMKLMDVAAIGPGLSTRESIGNLLESIIDKATIPLVLDADALNALAGNVSVLKRLKTEAVITPHPGEMSRLMGISIHEIQNNRIEIAKEFSQKWKVVTVLKGSKTVIAQPDGTIYINCTGNPGMATGGTGDVLTGIIAGLIGQGVSPQDAAVASVYIHGAAGDTVAKAKGEYGTLAGDIIEELPYTVKKLVND